MSFGVGVTSLALMHTQIVLTRLFSVVVWYHFAFFAISVALLGLSASAVAVHALQSKLASLSIPRILGAVSLLFALSILGLAFAVIHVTPDWFGAGEAAFFTSFTPKLLLIFCATTGPFFVGGFVLSLAMSRWSASIHRIYAYDLAGAAVACGIVIPVLNTLGGPDALVLSAGFAGLAAVIFGSADRPALHLRAVAVWVCLAGLVVGPGVLGAASGALQIRVAKGLDLTRSAPEYSRWNSFSLISVFPSWHFHGWGLSPKYTAPIPAEKSLVIDMNAYTPLLAFDGDFADVAHTRYDLSSLAFSLRPPTHVCIVGAGGGKDVLAALASGATRVTALEVNPLIADDVMRHQYKEFNGGLYDRPDVELHIEDGRSFLRGSREQYDVVLVSMVDTSAATAAGAYALAENGLYTVDAFKDFMARLTPDGILTVSSVSLPGLAVGTRLAALARAALNEMGRDPARAVAVVETHWLAVNGATMYNILVKPNGFDARELQGLRDLTDERGFRLTYLPNSSTGSAQGEQHWIARTLREPDREALAAEQASWPLDVSAVYDDRPYFFYQNRLRESWRALWSPGDAHLFGNGLSVLLKVLLVSIFMVAACIIVPLAWLQRDHGHTSKHAVWRILYVASLGLGYMFLEVGCIQRLLLYLGTPTYALTAVLLVLLLSGGIGSRTAAAQAAGSIQRFLLALVVYAALWMWTWPFIAEATVQLPLSGRALLGGMSLVPLGFLMGIPLPSGLRMVQLRDREHIAWLWGVNGATSVLGSVLATLGSMHLGITAVLGIGVVLYLATATLWIRVGAVVTDEP